MISAERMDSVNKFFEVGHFNMAQKIKKMYVLLEAISSDTLDRRSD